MLPTLAISEFSYLHPVRAHEPMDRCQILSGSLYALQKWTVIDYPVAFDIFIQDIKIRNWQITNAIIKYVDSAVFIVAVVLLGFISFKIKSEGC